MRHTPQDSGSLGCPTSILDDGNSQVSYSVNAKTSDVVKIALQLFAHDMQTITGRAAKEKANAPLQIFQMDQLSNKEFAILEKYNLPIHHFITKKESFYIATRNGKLIVVEAMPAAQPTAYWNSRAWQAYRHGPTGMTPSPISRAP